jgi:hypothetical protein
MRHKLRIFVEIKKDLITRQEKRHTQKYRRVREKERVGNRLSRSGVEHRWGGWGLPCWDRSASEINRSTRPRGRPKRQPAKKSKI